MKFEKPSQAAQRLGVTPRAVQKWAVEGRIPNAHKIAGQWMIPVDFTTPVDKNTVVYMDIKDSIRIPQSLINSDFEPGSCIAYIESMENEDEKSIAYAEYYHYCGRSDEAIKLAEPYIESNDAYLRNPACLIYIFANLSCGHLHLAKYALAVLKEKSGVTAETIKIPEMHSMLVWTAHVATIVFHTDAIELEPLEDWIRYLPEGMKLFACYMIAYRMRLVKKYQGAHSVARIAVQLSKENCVLSRIFCKLIDAIALMDMKMVDAAEKQFMLAWDLAKEDGFIEPFAEHFVLFQGLAERCLKNTYPDEYKKITAKAQMYYEKWRVLNEKDNGGLSGELTVSEFSIAMLYAKGWSAKEISAHLDISVRTVYRNISNIYATLGIGSVAELKDYMLN